MSQLSNILETVRHFAIIKINNYPTEVVYHDIKFAMRYQDHINTIANCESIDEETLQIGKIAGWLIAASYEHLEVTIGKDLKSKSNQEKQVLSTIDTFSTNHELPEKLQNEISLAAKEIFNDDEPVSILSQLLYDSLNMDLVLGKNKSNLQRLYDELVLNGANLSKKKWTDYALGTLNSLKFHVPICAIEIKPKLDSLLAGLEKEKKNIKKQSDLSLRKQFDINESELKDLKKKLKNSSGRDDRAIQTMFKVTSKNHYTLNEMVDKKANIMITVNAIILSLVLGGLVMQATNHGHFHFDSHDVPIILMTLTAVFSIIFAVLSIRPNVTHGQFTDEDIKNKKGNLLFFGNFHQMSEEDFEWGFHEMMYDQEFLYSSMIKDLYYLGQVLERKYRQIRISLTIFLFGIPASILSLFILKFIFDL